MNEAPLSMGAVCGPDEHCITCGDVALPMRVLSVDTVARLADCRLETSDEVEMVDVGLMDDVRAGDRLLVHAGTALTKLQDMEGSHAGPLHPTEEVAA